MNRKTLCSVWTNPHNGQKIVIPGKKLETRKEAVRIIGAYGDSTRNLECVEEWWSDAKLKALPDGDS